MQSSNFDGIKKLNEEYEDGLFHLVMNNVAKKEGKLLLEENERLKNESIPAPVIKKFTKLLDSHLKAKKSLKSHRMPKIISRAAVVMLAIIVALSITVVSVQALRIQVLNFLISIEPKFTSLQLESSNDGQSDGKLLVNWKNAYVPTYIPEDFEVIGLSYSDSIKMIKFENKVDKLTIIYTEYESINSIAVDTEDASVEKIKINGQDGTLSVKDSTTSVAWIINDHLFTIQGQISKDEIIKMAEGVKFIK